MRVVAGPPITDAAAGLAAAVAHGSVATLLLR
jgi:hypothetical protein